MSLSTQSSQRVPAWKRLGLKLKSGAPETQAEGPADLHANDSSVPNSSTPAKRKSSAAFTSDHSAKKARRDDPITPTTQPHQLKKRKSVTFAAETDEAPTTNGKPAAKKQKAKKPANKTSGETSPAKPQTKKQSSVNLEPALDYLRQWHSARDQWKFNKNNQSKLLENAFTDETTIPAFDINIFYEYIKGLKGFVRQRLRETAEEIKEKDMEQGSKHFSSSSTEVAERKQKDYEEIIAGFMREGRTPEKRRFEEVEYVLRTADMEMQRRVVKRMRAETVIEALAESEDTTSGSSTAADAEKETESGQGQSGPTSADVDGDKRVKLNDGSQRKLSRRKAKIRTAEIEDDSSSESESEAESDSETSSSGSSSEDDSDDEAAEISNVPQNDAETSSSSSSSSSEASDSDSEDGSGEDD